VRKGDTLFAISRKTKVPLRALIEANRLRPPYALKAKRVLKVPAIRAYVVAKGDTLYGISRRFGASVNAIVRQNDLKGPGFRIHPGGRLILPWTAPPKTLPRRATALARSQRPAARPTLPGKVKRDKNWLEARPLAKKPRRRDAVPARLARHPPPRAKSKFRWPVKGRIISGFGAKGRGLHNDGINIAARKGATVRAAENGVVAYAGNELRGYGNLLLIRHADGWVSAYAHNGAILVAKGQVVRRGQPVARVGSSGTVTRPQLHFELRRGRRTVDPKRYLARRT
jgi:murein DD-endopeptidase MepM/ murein hydrolase activator NlpD